MRTSAPRRSPYAISALRWSHVPAGKVPQAVVTFAENACDPPSATEVEAGTTATLNTRSGATLTVTVAIWAASACACAVTRQGPDPRKEVKMPALVMVPQDAGALQTTALSADPLMVALSATASHANA